MSPEAVVNNKNYSAHHIYSYYENIPLSFTNEIINKINLTNEISVFTKSY